MTIADQFRKYKTDVEFHLQDRYNKKLVAVTTADDLIKAFDNKISPIKFVNEIAEAKKLKVN
jgi:hypothetical protein